MSTALTLLADHLIVVLGGELYAISLDAIHEIVRPSPITRVPRSRADIMGVASVRGRLVTVFDLRASIRLPAPPLDARARIVLLEDDRTDVGFAVEEVQEVEQLSSSQIEPASALGGVDRPYLRGVARRGTDAILMLDLYPLVPGASPGPTSAAGEAP